MMIGNRVLTSVLIIFGLILALGTVSHAAQSPEPTLQKVVSFPKHQLAGVAVSKENRVFISFPRWKEPYTIAVGEVMPDGKISPFPDPMWNIWNAQMNPAEHFVSVQAVFVDDTNTLWILDPASPAFQGVVPNGPKLMKVNLADNTISRIYAFDATQAPQASYLNDIRVDTVDNVAYISDSGMGAILVMDLQTGAVRRVLETDPSTKAEPGFNLLVNGEELRDANGNTPQIHVDGIALDPERRYLYYHPLTGTKLYRIDTQYLKDPTLSEADLAQHVELVARTGPTDGMVMRDNHSIYLTSFTDSAIKRYNLSGKLETVVQDDLLSWPDSFSLGPDGRTLFVTTSQIQTMPMFNNGQDTHQLPYRVYQMKLP